MKTLEQRFIDLINEKQVEINTLEEENTLLKNKIVALTTNNELLENCVIELAQEVYK